MQKSKDTLTLAQYDETHQEIFSLIISKKGKSRGIRLYHRTDGWYMDCTYGNGYLEKFLAEAKTIAKNGTSITPHKG